MLAERRAAVRHLSDKRYIRSQLSVYDSYFVAQEYRGAND